MKEKDIKEMVKQKYSEINLNLRYGMCDSFKYLLAIDKYSTYE